MYCGRALRVYIAATVFVALFGAVYECFSFGVYSYYMIYAFSVPLLLGVVPAAQLATAKQPKYVPLAARRLHHTGVGTLTVGAIVRGVLEIYGTSNDLCMVYGLAGGVLVTLAVLIALLSRETPVQREC